MMRSLFDDQSARPLSVSELNEQVKSHLERSFSSVWVEGEIVGFHEARSGHWYFNLHDGESQIKITCFKGTNWRIRFEPFDGLQVRVRGKVSVYLPRGEYQVIAESLEPVGEGALAVAYEQIRNKLSAEGLFDEEHKRPLPFFPRRIGVVTSPKGAAFYDILNVLMRRTKSVSTILIPSLVQGETAPGELRQAILFAQEYNRKVPAEERIQVLIVGRGGGSPEDLWAFNEEMLARTIFESEIPVISAVGHETDVTISDLVADVRAATPSAAAEIVAGREDLLEQRISRAERDLGRHLAHLLLRKKQALSAATASGAFFEMPARVSALRNEVRELRMKIGSLASGKLEISADRVNRLAARLSPVRLSKRIAERERRLLVASQRNYAAMRRVMSVADEKLKVRMASLDALSPLSVLGRGFSLARGPDGSIVRDAGTLVPGDEISVRFGRGSASAEVKRVEREEDH